MANSNGSPPAGSTDVGQSAQSSAGGPAAESTPAPRRRRPAIAPGAETAPLPQRDPIVAPPKRTPHKRTTARASESEENALWPAQPAVRRRHAPRIEPARVAPVESDESPAPRAPAAAPRPASESNELPADTDSIPPEILERFERRGRHFHFRDGARAFTDRGRKLTTPSENTQVIRSLVAIAQARGWHEIHIKGTDRFKRAAWFAAREAGLKVRGYELRAHEEQQLAPARPQSAGRTNRVAHEAAGRTAAQAVPGAAAGQVPLSPTKPERETGRLLTGRLIDHGPAPYHHDSRRPTSYFVKIETATGAQEIWGVDLHRALKQSLTRPQIGDEVGLRAVRREAVKVWTATRDPEGNVVGQKRLDTHRNAWILEKLEFFRERADAARIVRDPNMDPEQTVKKHPQLVGTILQIEAAKLAARSFSHPKDGERFVGKVRNALADSVRRGEPLEPVRILQPAQTAPSKESPSHERERIPER